MRNDSFTNFYLINFDKQSFLVKNFTNFYLINFDKQSFLVKKNSKVLLFYFITLIKKLYLIILSTLLNLSTKYLSKNHFSIVYT